MADKFLLPIKKIEMLKIKPIDSFKSWEAEQREREKERNRFSTWHRPPKKKGGIYIIKAEGHPWYKIGCSTDLDKRTRAIRASLPFKSTLLHTWPSDDIAVDEKKLHRRFKRKRMHGEWFELSDEDVEQLLKLKKFGG